MDISEIKTRFTSVLDTASRDELESLARILEPESRTVTLKYREGKSVFLEIPEPLTEAIQILIRSRWPELALKWNDASRSALERDVDARLQRMRKG